MTATLRRPHPDINTGKGDFRAGDEVFGLAYGSAVSREYPPALPSPRELLDDHESVANPWPVCRAYSGIREYAYAQASEPQV